MSAPETVEFNVASVDGTHLGSSVTCALPAHGDLIRIDEPGKQPIYEVLRAYFEPDNITVIVRPSGSGGSLSAFAGQEHGAGGFS